MSQDVAVDVLHEQVLGRLGTGFTYPVVETVPLPEVRSHCSCLSSHLTFLAVKFRVTFFPSVGIWKPERSDRTGLNLSCLTVVFQANDELNFVVNEVNEFRLIRN